MQSLLCGCISDNVLRIREADNCVGFVGRDWRFTLYAVIGCPSFGIINLKKNIKCIEN
jgi:hypothetical protein